MTRKRSRVVGKVRATELDIDVPTDDGDGPEDSGAEQDDEREVARERDKHREILEREHVELSKLKALVFGEPSIFLGEVDYLKPKTQSLLMEGRMAQLREELRDVLAAWRVDAPRRGASR